MNERSSRKPSHRVVEGPPGHVAIPCLGVPHARWRDQASWMTKLIGFVVVVAVLGTVAMAWSPSPTPNAIDEQRNLAILKTDVDTLPAFKIDDNSTMLLGP